MTWIGRETDLTAIEQPTYDDSVVLREPALEMSDPSGVRALQRMIRYLAVWAAVAVLIIAVGRALSMTRYLIGGVWMAAGVVGWVSARVTDRNRSA